MSVQAMAWVFEHSESTLGARLLLLAIASHADRDGRNSWASVRSLAEEARLSERQARYSLRQLEKAGEICETGRSSRATHVYELPLMGGALSAGGGQSATARGAIHDTDRGQTLPPNQDLEPSLNVDLAPSRRPRKRDELFEAVMEVSGIDLAEIPEEARGSYNAASSGLRKLGATPEEVRRRAPRAWFTVTPAALLRHWAELRGGPRTSTITVDEPCEECRGRTSHRAWCSKSGWGEAEDERLAGGDMLPVPPAGEQAVDGG